jgi:hypothetical protein
VSIFDYKQAQEIEAKGYSFYALIQAAMRQADSNNREKLKEMFPEVWDDLVQRYNAPGGYLPGEPLLVEDEYEENEEYEEREEYRDE